MFSGVAAAVVQDRGLATVVNVRHNDAVSLLVVDPPATAESIVVQRAYLEIAIAKIPVRTNCSFFGEVCIYFYFFWQKLIIKYFILTLLISYAAFI